MDSSPSAKNQDFCVSTSISSSLDKSHDQAIIRNDPTNVSNIDLSHPETQDALDKLYRKLDWRIIPPLWILYFLTSMGSALYGNALTMNMSTKDSLKQQLHLTPHDTSTASALYYVGYIILMFL